MIAPSRPRQKAGVQSHGADEAEAKDKKEDVRHSFAPAVAGC